jgi:hypothetical protein
LIELLLVNDGELVTTSLCWESSNFDNLAKMLFNADRRDPISLADGDKNLFSILRYITYMNSKCDCRIVCDLLKSMFIDLDVFEISELIDSCEDNIQRS